MLKSCLKKDFLGLTRQKNNIVVFLIPILCAIMALIMIISMSLLLSYTEGVSDPNSVTGVINDMMSKTWSGSINTFISILSTYAIIYYIIVLRNSISKEIASKKWILPLNAGIKSTNLYLSKLFSYLIWISISLIFAFLVNFVFTTTICENNGIEIKDILLSYMFIFLYILMFINILISLDYVAKKSWLGVLVSLILLIFVPDMFNGIKIGSFALLDYTPFSYMEKSLLLGDYFGSLPFIISIIIYMVIMIGLPIMAIFTNKIKSKDSENLIKNNT